jgi:hypothetical protein
MNCRYGNSVGRRFGLGVIALITWIITALLGLFLLVIWLIEYDPDFQSAAATRLPIPVISAHVLLALSGLALWIVYLASDKDSLELGALAVLALVAIFGVTMAVRWVKVYRATPRPTAGSGLVVPPERHFPVSLVIAHGIFAFTTILLAVLTVLGVGGS